MTPTRQISITLLGAFIIAATLYAWGQPPICTCGQVLFWVGSIFSSGNSQHIADWYTLSHILHGILVVLITRLVAPRLSFAYVFGIAIITGVGWEVIEHTDWVLGQFRTTTINQGYTGDSVLNAVADYIWMLGGFFLAYSLRTVWIFATIIVLELSAALIARDSLTLSTLMFFHRVEAVDTWQQAINPNAQNPD